MSDEQEDFFAVSDFGGLIRDNYDRPMLIPHGGGERVPYTRASSYAGRIENAVGLHRWEQRYLARAMAEYDDLRLLAAGEIYTTGYDMPDKDENRESGKRLDDVIARGLDRMGVHQKADFGTAVHSFVTPVEGHPNPVPVTEPPFPDFQAHVTGYREKLARENIQVLTSERFIANDAVMAAGTYDGVYHHPEYGVVIGDVKTGKNKVGFAVQTAIYANGVHYDVDTDARSPIHPELNREVGLLFYVTEKGTEIKRVDLVLAWELTQHIRAIFEDYKIGKLIFPLEPTAVTLLDRIGQTKTLDELTGLWRETKAEWGEEHRMAAKLQKEFF